MIKLNDILNLANLEEIMTYMLCRNKVKDFKVWKNIFDSHCDAQNASGLVFEKMWIDKNDENNIFFIFKVTDLEKANAFINAPESAQAGINSGVIDGEIYFVEEL